MMRFNPKTTEVINEVFVVLTHAYLAQQKSFKSDGYIYIIIHATCSLGTSRVSVAKDGIELALAETQSY